jgi:kumamolisin
MTKMIPCAGRTCIVAFLAAAAFALTFASATPQKKDRKVFADSVRLLPEQGVTKTGLHVNASTPERKTDKMDLLFSLSISKEAEEKLEARVAKGEVISPEELEKIYTPKPADFEALTKWLKEQDFEVTHVNPDRTAVYVRATVGQVEKSLQVQMVTVFKEGLTYNAARTAPSLPTDAAAGVRAIIGLQPYRHARRHSKKTMPRGGNRAMDKASPNIVNAPPYVISEVLKAYNAHDVNMTGAGQKIAILIDTLPRDADLKEFWKQNNLDIPLTHVEKINVKGGHLPTPEGEETLDVQWSTGIAPGATVKVYASGSLSFTNLDRALDRIIADLPKEPGMRQLSISLGLGETLMVPDEVATQHKKFLRLSAAGVNVFVSSGDGGSRSGGPTDQAEYESSDPCVIGVGGTTLFIDQNTGNVAKEEAWSGSGGGKSLFFPRPVWQKGLGIGTGSERLVPDVALAADPDRGALVILHGQAQQIGGTSWSAPTWAGFCALINESRSKAKKSPLPYLNPVIYPRMDKCFRDITIGNNGGFNAGDGHDLVTGIGVPDVAALMKELTQTLD